MFLFNNTRFSGNINQTLRSVAVPGQVTAKIYDKKHIHPFYYSIVDVKYYLTFREFYKFNIVCTICYVDQTKHHMNVPKLSIYPL